MNKLTLNSLFGPLDRKYCDWFYYLSIIAVIFMVLTVAALVVALFSQQVKYEYVGGAVYAVLMYAAFYFQNRLLYGMCTR